MERVIRMADMSDNVVFFHALDASGRLITVHGLLVEERAYSLTLQHSNGEQHTYASAFDLRGLKVGNHYRAFAFQREGIDAFTRLYPLPRIVHPDGDPNSPFDADKEAVELYAYDQAESVAAAARALVADLLAEEERLKTQITTLLAQLQVAGKVAADYTRDVEQLLAPGPASIAVPTTGMVALTNRVPVKLSRRPLPPRVELRPVAIPGVEDVPGPVEALPAGRAAKVSPRKQKSKTGKDQLSRADRKKLKKRAGWLSA